MNIDFIKWMVGYAEGYHWYENEIHFPNGNYMEFNDLEEDDWKDIYYPLLLPKAIEGFNRKHDILRFIEQYCDHIGYAYNEKEIHLLYYKDIHEDQAKEQALKYIWEQEKK